MVFIPYLYLTEQHITLKGLKLEPYFLMNIFFITRI